MKICLALPVLAQAQDDTSTLLSLKVHTSLEAGVDHLLDAVGSRNVTQMSSLLQNLVEESISDGLGELDGDVKTALALIKAELLGDIRNSLREAHCFSQVNLHQNVLCFENCEKDKATGHASCGKKCDGSVHKSCRDDLFGLYKEHITACRDLDHFVATTLSPCPSYDKTCCYLPHTTWNCQGPCASKVDKIDHLEVDGKVGKWMLKQIGLFESTFKEWEGLYKSCRASYRAYVEKDAECDCAQAECEARNCEYDSCHFLNCEVSYQKCWGACEIDICKSYPKEQCLEKDRKIDWSATEKIECYVDVLMANPTKDELLKKCGTEDCINKWREEMYLDCNKRCPEVDTEAKDSPLDFPKFRGPFKRDRKAEIGNLAPYPGYSGELKVTGYASAKYNGKTADIIYGLSGLEKECATVPEGVANACGIHIHEGKTCENADEVGGHYYDKDSISADPWDATTVYKTEKHGRAKGMVRAIIGDAKSVDILGRAIVVHDKTGARVACALIKEETDEEWLGAEDQCETEGDFVGRDNKCIDTIKEMIEAMGSHKRRKGRWADEDVTGEGEDSVITKHRLKGGEEGIRCTDHLDLDWQMPPCCSPCEERDSAPCEDGGKGDESKYMWQFYGQHGFLNPAAIDDFTRDKCYESAGEHTYEYAYNLCTCVDCPKKDPAPCPNCIARKGCGGSYGSYDYKAHYAARDNDCAARDDGDRSGVGYAAAKKALDGEKEVLKELSADLAEGPEDEQ